MKSKLLYILFFILFAYCLASGIRVILDVTGSVFGDDDKIIENEILDNNENILELSVEKYNYDNIENIKLLHSKTGVVEDVLLDEYIVNVVAAEMPVEYELEALKAQAIVARTYTMYKIENKKHENADICDDFNCCQAWISKEDRFLKWDNNQIENWNKLVTAVNETKGKYITYNGKVINAFFHSNSSGKTEVPQNVWGGYLPYLDVVEVSGEENYSSYKSEVILDKKGFFNRLRNMYENFEIDFESKNKDSVIKVLEYTEGGRVKKIKIGNMVFSGVEIRKIFNLKSSNFEVTIDGENIIFKVLGYGHGVGLSQTGSDALAKQGFVSDEIIKHFYKNIEIHE